jgi:DNA helicase II / ATP-dependent DNA helicase PcrA
MNTNTTEAYLKSYNELNAAQKEAVDTTEGPVLVLAGPGTGKTQILATRIGNILLQGNANFDNILCLTFTEAGAMAMRKRLQQLIGVEATRIAVHTFHSFCNSVIQENINLFPIKTSDPADQLDLQLIFEDIENGIEPTSIIKNLKFPNYTVKALNEMANIINTEKLSLEQIKVACEEHIEYILSFKGQEIEKDSPFYEDYKDFYYTRKYKEFEKGDLKPKALEEQKENYAKTIAFAEQYGSYVQLKADRGLYDFNDMINWVGDVFKSNPGLLARYQERFQYFLIDEFQDTNGAQKELVYLLLQGQESPNVFVVGDDDQSIYRFQGASFENLQEFIDRFSDTKKNPLGLTKIVLTENYRSSQNILNLSRHIIEHNIDRLSNNKSLGLEKNLTAKHKDFKSLEAKPTLKEFTDIHHELGWVLNDINKKLKDGVKASEIAIIYGKNETGKQIIPYCDLLNIPYEYSFAIDVLQHPLVENLIQVIQLIHYRLSDYPKSDLNLVELLHAPFFNLKPHHIAAAYVGFKNKEISEKAFDLKFYDYILETKNQQLLPSIEIIEQLIKNSIELSCEQFLSEVLTKTGVLNYILHHKDKFKLLSIVKNFVDFVKKRLKAEKIIDLQGLIGLLESMQIHNISLPYQTQFFSLDSIKLLTAHKSKGLEFEYVYVINLQDKEWESSGKNKSFTFPPGLLSHQSAKEDAIQEKRRLFFVACTRAKKELYLSYHQFKEDGKETKKSAFYEEVEKNEALYTDARKDKPIDEAEHNFMHLFASLNANAQPNVEAIDNAILDKRLENIKLNASNIDSYIDCQLRFYYNSILKLPTAKTSSLEFGSTMHKALEEALKEFIVFGTHLSLEQVLEIIQNDLDSKRHILTKKEIENLKAHAGSLMDKIYERLIQQFGKESVPEKFVSTEIGQAQINGKLDKIELIGNTTVLITDYKTGNFKKEKFKVGESLEGEIGSYWLQGVIYAILLEKEYPGKNVIVEFVFIEDDDLKKEIVEINSEVKDRVKTWIKEIYQKIKDKEFYKGCGKPECKYCNMVKHNQYDLKIDSEELESIV